MAYKLAQEWGDKIPIGVLYEIDAKTYEDYDPVISSKALIEKPPVKLTPEALSEFF